MFSTHPDVIVIFETFLYMIEELQDVQPLQAAVQQRVHTLKSCFAHIQTIIHCVFEWTHLHLHHANMSYPQIFENHEDWNIFIA